MKVSGPPGGGELGGDLHHSSHLPSGFFISEAFRVSSSPAPVLSTCPATGDSCLLTCLSKDSVCLRPTQAHLGALTPACCLEAECQVGPHLKFGAGTGAPEVEETV